MSSNKRKGLCIYIFISANHHDLQLFFYLYFFVVVVCVCAEIIYIDSSETSSEPVHGQMPWSEYFPKVEPSSSDDEVISYQLGKTGEASKLPTEKELGKKPVKEKIKVVVGLPNKAMCQQYGIKPFAPKVPKDATEGSKGKGKRFMG